MIKTRFRATVGWGTCGRILRHIERLKRLLLEAEATLSRSAAEKRPILEVGIGAIRQELKSVSRRLPMVG